TGTLYDQRGVPLWGASAAAQPEAMNVATTSGDGQFTLGLAVGGTYALLASHPVLDSLPPMKNISVNGDVGGVELYLPPATNLIQNGDFESSGGWQMSGAAPIGGKGHTGDYALAMGEQSPLSPGPWTASQTVSVPRNATYVTLDWCYRVEGDSAKQDEFLVTVHGASADQSRVLDLGAGGWTHDWMDLAGFAGQDVVVTFRLSHQAEDVPLTVLLDDVGLGTGRLAVVHLPLVARSR
ncbi:MAG TPA: carboxypeptidase-like regulatory domain-containing protein, partial [Mycobacterium sp.]|nr:carboxypeptidase-like regulatory domain-containing protein [Mycobacterium sp.]